MEEFKQVHKQWDSSKNVNDTVSELRKDLQVMQDDHDVLTRRIERIQRKVGPKLSHHRTCIYTIKFQLINNKRWRMWPITSNS